MTKLRVSNPSTGGCTEQDELLRSRLGYIHMVDDCGGMTGYSGR